MQVTEFLKQWQGAGSKREHSHRKTHYQPSQKDFWRVGYYFVWRCGLSDSQMQENVIGALWEETVKDFKATWWAVDCLVLRRQTADILCMKLGLWLQKRECYTHHTCRKFRYQRTSAHPSLSSFYGLLETQTRPLPEKNENFQPCLPVGSVTGEIYFPYRKIYWPQTIGRGFCQAL